MIVQNSNIPLNQAVSLFPTSSPLMKQSPIIISFIYLTTHTSTISTLPSSLPFIPTTHSTLTSILPTFLSFVQLGFHQTNPLLLHPPFYLFFPPFISLQSTIPLTILHPPTRRASLSSSQRTISSISSFCLSLVPFHHLHSSVHPSLRPSSGAIKRPSSP